MFPLGIRLLTENLEILRDEERRFEMPDSEQQIDDALDRVRALSGCVRSAQPLTVVDFSQLGQRSAHNRDTRIERPGYFLAP